MNQETVAERQGGLVVNVMSTPPSDGSISRSAQVIAMKIQGFIHVSLLFTLAVTS